MNWLFVEVSGDGIEEEVRVQHHHQKHRIERVALLGVVLRRVQLEQGIEEKVGDFLNSVMRRLVRQVEETRVTQVLLLSVRHSAAQTVIVSRRIRVAHRRVAQLVLRVHVASALVGAKNQPDEGEDVEEQHQIPAGKELQRSLDQAERDGWNVVVQDVVEPDAEEGAMRCVVHQRKLGMNIMRLMQRDSGVVASDSSSSLREGSRRS